MNNDHKRGIRGDVEGWTERSSRSNTRFLYSVDERGLDDGNGYALSLTLKQCPDTHAEWQRMRRAFVERLRRMGLIRLHWLTEWQRRGVPHLHAAVWFPRTPSNNGLTVSAGDIVAAWLFVAAPFGAKRPGQHVAPIVDEVGWFKYLAKHAVRGLHHYQRNRANIPAGWKKTGRMWGKSGDWPTREFARIELDKPGFYAFRRIVRRWRLADARRAGDARRIRSARRMLQCSDPVVCELRGVSEWIGEPMQDAILAHLAASGYSVKS